MQLCFYSNSKLIPCNLAADIDSAYCLRIDKLPENKCSIVKYYVILILMVQTKILVAKEIAVRILFSESHWWSAACKHFLTFQLVVFEILVVVLNGLVITK